jgi:putative hemolysin
MFGTDFPPAVQGALERILLLNRLSEIYKEAERPTSEPFFDRMLGVLQVQPKVSPLDLARIPKEGPVVAVANHPFGLIEGVILAARLPSVRRDIKFMANFLLAGFPEVAQHCILVDPFHTSDSNVTNRKGLRETLTHLKRGGMVVVFPAGEVAHLDWRQRQITDPEWSETIARIVRISGAAVLPMFFQGSNSALFHVLGLLHPRLRTAMLPHEFFNKQRQTIELRVGNVIPPKRLQTFADDSSLIRYLRQRTYLLGSRQRPARGLTPLFLRRRTHRTALEPVVAPVPPEVLAREIEELGPAQVAAQSGELRAILARAHQIPSTLREIGRLRETTFRLTGEGTGKATDLDAFDSHYLHLFVWNQQAREVIGAYRLGPSDEIVGRFGKKGLYTSTLFAYRRGFLDRIGPALELGRSFVRPEYQRSYAPLLMLWKGIGHFLTRHPQYRVLFGPVSISNEYNPGSQELMVGFLKAQRHSRDLARLVRPRSPFRRRPARVLEAMQEELANTAVWDIEELSMMVADLETEQKGIPVLLKQYLKLGGKLVAFNVDGNFSDALDGLIVVDLVETNPRVLERYMGKAEAESFLEYHKTAGTARVSA